MSLSTHDCTIEVVCRDFAYINVCVSEHRLPRFARWLKFAFYILLYYPSIFSLSF